MMADPALIRVRLGTEIVLRDQDDSRRFFLIIDVPESINEVEELMHYATHYLLGDIDTVGQNRMVLADEKGNIHITMIDSIQAISIYAPEELPEGLGSE